jgi:hypothetical protein
MNVRANPFHVSQSAVTKPVPVIIDTALKPPYRIASMSSGTSPAMSTLTTSTTLASARRTM